MLQVPVNVIGIRNLMRPMSFSKVFGLNSGCKKYSSVASVRVLGSLAFKLLSPN
jgi:hypothetical protein